MRDEQIYDTLEQLDEYEAEHERIERMRKRKAIEYEIADDRREEMLFDEFIRD